MPSFLPRRFKGPLIVVRGRSAWNLALAAALAFANIPGVAQETSVNPPAQAEAGNYKIRVRSNLVFLPTQVQNNKGEPIYGLKPEDFIVEDNGVRQPVRVDEEPDSSGLSLVVAVQCSRSAPLEFSKLKGLGAMIDLITGEAQHEVAIVGYGERPYLLGDFSRKPEAVPLALSKLKPCGYTGAASIDAAYYASSMLNRLQTHYRRAILLIGETRDHGSRSRLDDVVTELGVTDTVIYTVAFAPAKDEFIDGLRHGPNGPNPPPAPVFPKTPSAPKADASSSAPPAPDPSGDIDHYTEHVPLFALPPQIMPLINALRTNSASGLASLSGGQYLKFTTQRSFEQDLQRVSDQLHTYYLLSFTPPSGPAWGLHALRVRVAGRPGAVVHTRRSYWAGVLESAGGNVR
jgi:VWFA-related protein